MADIGRRGDRVGIRSPVAVYPRGYPHLPLKQEIDRHGWTQEPDEAAADMYESAMALLDAAGYEQYEISNVCRPAAIAPQPEILDRRRVAGVRTRRAFDVAGADGAISRPPRTMSGKRPATSRSSPSAAS